TCHGTSLHWLVVDSWLFFTLLTLLTLPISHLPTSPYSLPPICARNLLADVMQACGQIKSFL
ncbi:hypothetical protein, partial [Fischerella thermalis]|uniref:hypothetical protein n=1 Tax=Fischerella thermalis TaxID=372787 RepID=UPI001CA59AC0